MSEPKVPEKLEDVPVNARIKHHPHTVAINDLIDYVKWVKEGMLQANEYAGFASGLAKKVSKDLDHLREEFVAHRETDAPSGIENPEPEHTCGECAKFVPHRCGDTHNPDEIATGYACFSPKKRNTCGECDWYNDELHICDSPDKKRVAPDPACIDFTPKKPYDIEEEPCVTCGVRHHASVPCVSVPDHRSLGEPERCCDEQRTLYRTNAAFEAWEVWCPIHGYQNDCWKCHAGAPGFIGTELCVKHGTHGEKA